MFERAILRIIRWWLHRQEWRLLNRCVESLGMCPQSHWDHLRAYTQAQAGVRECIKASQAQQEGGE